MPGRIWAPSKRKRRWLQVRREIRKDKNPDDNRPRGGETKMGEQHSQKKGLRSSAQKENRARDAYAELPASSRSAGAFGTNRRTTPTDKELSLSQATKGSA